MAESLCLCLRWWVCRELGAGRLELTGRLAPAPAWVPKWTFVF